FMLSDTEYLSPVVLFEKGKVASQIVYSNLKEIVEQQQYFLILFGARQYQQKTEFLNLNMELNHLL
ncbi:MAG: hypothetical protein ACJ71F_01835, partial [Nitrososphaeraceae archaeon]